VTTRAVSAGAGVQPPTLYRLFGDMQGLLDAVALALFAAYVEGKTALPASADPIEDLRRGWDRYVAFNVQNPEVFLHIYANQRRGPASVVAARGIERLRQLVERMAKAGCLAVSIPHAVQLMHAAAQGVILTMINQPETQRDPDVSASLRESVLARIAVPCDGSTTSSEPRTIASYAIALGATIRAEGCELSEAEQRLLLEWLDRLSH